MKTDFDLFICTETDSLRKVMQIIGKGMKKIAFVLDGEFKRLVGTVTDGDIRRGLLNGLELSDQISLCMNREFKYLRDDEVEINSFQFSNGITVMPVVNADMELKGYEEVTISSVPIAAPWLRGNELLYLTDAVLSTWISSSGKYIEEFENKFAQYCGMQYGVAVSNGTTALHLALAALGIGEGDEVIVPDLTFAATINAVLYTGATPVIVDIEKDSWCIEPDEIRKAISPATKAILPVHLYGQPCNMGEIMKIAEEYNVYVVEDCAEAHGAEFDGRKVGSFGIISCFSFFANKVITTGEGGMCLTNDRKLEEKMRILRDHGMSKKRKYYHEVVGFNYRMTNLQAAIGVAQVEKIDEIQSYRYNLERVYREKLRDIEGIVFQKDNFPLRTKIVWLVSILVPEEKREYYIQKLKKNGIDVRPFFIPLSEMEIYSQYTFSNKNSSQIARLGLNLPTSLDVNEDIVNKVAEIFSSTE